MNSERQTLADYVAIAISPVLIMAMVGSLVFFLLELLYAGVYYGRLQWILFFFVFGAVLVARVSMTGGIADRAPLYGLVLGILTWIALLIYVEYPPDHPMAAWAINLGLICLIWWSAHRITWDCTFIDDEVKASGTGLLEAAGLDKPAKESSPDPSPAEEKAKEKADKKKNREPGGFFGWLDRWRKYREERLRKHNTPGVWVVYFSLAALPLFGLGQTQIPAEQVGRRNYAFWLMCIYVGSGLGLLVTTSFLGLRRYLRQRSLRMPAAMTGVWLLAGSMLIALMLIVGAVLPRPGGSNPLLEWTGLFQSPDRKPSPWAPGGKGKEADGGRRETNKDAKNGQGDVSKDGKNSQGQDKNGSKSQGDSKNGKEKDANGKQGQNKNDAKEKQGGGQGEDKETKGSGGKSKGSNGGKSAPPPPAMNPGGFLGQLAKVLKWVVIGILILLVVFILLRVGLRFLANFTHWARGLLNFFRAWWLGLSGLWQRRPAGNMEQEMAAQAPPRPFSAFRDPFLWGTAEGMSPVELVQYSFDALEAYARERDLGRNKGETPMEFAHRLGNEIPALEQDACRLADYYAGLAYARTSPPASSRERLRKFWLLLAEVVERPLSAAAR